jgi:acetyl-CoA carboxylase carboxyl transferase subunit alpha
VDEIVPEPLGGAHNQLAEMAQTLKAALLNNLEGLKKLPASERLKMRYQKYRAYGQFVEKKEKAAGLETPESNGNGTVPAIPA